MRRGNAGLGRGVSESRCARPPASREAPTAAAAAVVVVPTATSPVPQAGSKVGFCVLVKNGFQEIRMGSGDKVGFCVLVKNGFRSQGGFSVLSRMGSGAKTFGYEEIVQPVSLMGTDLRAQPGTSPNSQRPSRPWHDFARHTDSDKIQIPKIHTDDDKIHIPKL
ncbi:hypothetical protein Pcinc_033385 [Petrolisthes cinctipes]|uniref:Uncharacterized protein n=1 Tax=Petrolisthes cinctipes TaxID=88211 RepID=A0AAE1K1H4_PETCI|nr:hypothetical protein Pcinc_033385 [Petrolisthes cinctipes]